MAWAHIPACSHSKLNPYLSADYEFKGGFRLLTKTFLHFCRSTYPLPMKQALYQSFIEKKKAGQKSFAVLIDPDKVDAEKIDQLVTLASDSGVDYFFVGGSLVISSHLDECIRQIKTSCSIPVPEAFCRPKFLFMLSASVSEIPKEAVRATVIS